MDLTTLLNETDGQIWFLLKIFYLVAFGVFLLFSVIVWRQMALMARTLNGAIEIPLKMAGVALMLLAVVAMAAAAIVL